MYALKATRAGHEPIQLTLPARWSEVTTAQALSLIAKADELTERQIFTILTGLSVDELRPVRIPNLGNIIDGPLSFLLSVPDFTDMPAPTQLRIDGQVIDVPTNIGLESLGQKWDLDDELKDRESLGGYQNYLVAAEPLLSIYLFPVVTGENYKDISQANAFWPRLASLPCTDLLPLAAFFLASYMNLTNTGQPSLKTIRKRRWKFSWPASWFRPWMPSTRILPNA
ncbi:hypothetical protein DYU11_22645 [Fibrisoma montanum]|uniref:Uncharacterized protein n=1 Tax=Fibrisoma montanum TaxID=2305895 RepID=A0A418M1Z6_9BACT|nr:hypothetical protein [Fibrisoma montanum]RIV19731.1 hypothetical protein DYU11_22645 [Fibrisoma montanum]